MHSFVCVHIPVYMCVNMYIHKCWSHVTDSVLKTVCKTQSNLPIVGKQHVRGLGIMMSDDLMFREHNQANIAADRKMIGEDEPSNPGIPSQ